VARGSTAASIDTVAAAMDAGVLVGGVAVLRSVSEEVRKKKAGQRRAIYTRNPLVPIGGSNRG
jgi:hypothetical protein